MIPAVLPTYNRAPLSFVSGEGAWLVEADGRRFLDFGAGIAVNALGHAHPDLVRVLSDQAAQLWHVSNLYTIPAQEALAARLVDLTFADTVFFTNSGTEACELAVKMARKHWFEAGQPERTEMIAFEGSFHGRSAAGIAASDIDKILITHLHPDHIGGLLAGGVPVFANAELIVRDGEVGFWTDPATRSMLPAAMHPMLDGIAAVAAAYGDNITPLTGDRTVAPGVDSVSLPFLCNAVIDFSEELIGARFVIENPNATSSCGCGTSFSM